MASGVSKRFGEGHASVTAIAEATFEVRRGDQIALMGPSGSGKSTLLHLIAGLDVATGGTLTWPDLGDRARLRPGPIGLAFQGPALLPPLTVKENVALPLLLAGVREEPAGAQAEAMIEQFDLGPVADKLPEELSGGQNERAGVARALMGPPRLLLADEPTGQQDRATGHRLIDLILEHAGETDAAVVIATHDGAVARRFPLRWSITDGRLRVESG